MVHAWKINRQGCALARKMKEMWNARQKVKDYKKYINNFNRQEKKINKFYCINMGHRNSKNQNWSIKDIYNYTSS